jgi:ATP synthase protein I
MDDEREAKMPEGRLRFSQNIGAEEQRKLRARASARRSVWFGLGMLGLIGWSVAVPTLVGVALGVWLDHRHPGQHSWTLALLVAGLLIGCLNAWHWVVQESREIGGESEQDDG